jgi:hypothetical protein
MKYYLRFVLYLKEMKLIDKCSMPYTLHDSFASEVLSWPMVRPYRYNLASYVARGGLRCGFIPLEVWRQRTYALHSYAFIEVIFADDVVLYPQRYEDRGPTHCIPMREVIFAGIVDVGKCYTTYCGCSRKWDGIGYIGTTKFYIYKYFWS